MQTARRQNYRRSIRGALGSLIFLLGILITLIVACIGVDVAHFVSATSELQSVADAAAMMGCLDLEWNSTPAETTQATSDANYMVQHSSADLYSPSGFPIPSNSINVTFSSLNGGANNAITVVLNPPIVFLFAPIMISSAGSNLAGAQATAERLPVWMGPSPPWYLEATAQGGPTAPPPLPDPAPAPPTTFPANAYITFTGANGAGAASLAPPNLPCYWINLGLTSLSNANGNPPGIQSVMQCMGVCMSNNPSCTATNPIQIGAQTVPANNGSYNSALSSPNANSSSWTNGHTVLLPVSTNNNIVSVYAVQLVGPYVPNSYDNGQGVFGEFAVKFLARADSVPAVGVADPTLGTVYANVGATVAALIK